MYFVNESKCNWLTKSQWIVLLQKDQNNLSLVIKAVFNFCNQQFKFDHLFANILFSKIFKNPLNIWKTWNIERSSAFQLFGATVDSSLVDNINIAPQRPVKCFDNLVKKFDFNLIISNPKGSSNVKLVVTLETCTASQKARTKRQQKY